MTQFFLTLLFLTSFSLFLFCSFLNYTIPLPGKPQPNTIKFTIASNKGMILEGKGGRERGEGEGKGVTGTEISRKKNRVYPQFAFREKIEEFTYEKQ
jgi:hypothetical protein